MGGFERKAKVKGMPSHPVKIELGRHQTPKPGHEQKEPGKRPTWTAADLSNPTHDMQAGDFMKLPGKTPMPITHVEIYGGQRLVKLAGTRGTLSSVLHKQGWI